MKLVMWALLHPREALRRLASLARKAAPLALVFFVTATLPPLAVWLATRGHGAAHLVPSDPLRVDPGRDHLTTWQWADPAHIRLPIDQAITHYLEHAPR